MDPRLSQRVGRHGYSKLPVPTVVTSRTLLADYDSDHDKDGKNPH